MARLSPRWVVWSAAAALRGVLASGVEVNRTWDLAEAHRAWINDHSYGCGTHMHRNLADMYVADARFTATYDNVAPGLAAYLREAIHANADRRDASREDG